MFSDPKKLVAFVFVLIGLAVSAFFMVNVPLPPWSHWLSGLNVVLFAIPAFWATRRWLGWRDAGLLWAGLGVYALLVETSAIFTGFPYGHFGYSELLGAKLFGLTPWTVFLAWTPLIIGAYGLSRRLIPQAIVRVVFTALVAVAFDMVLDPGAVKLGFWRYEGKGAFYGVPLSNFAGWLITGVIAAILIELFLWKARPLLRAPVQLTSSVFFMIFFWTAIASFGGMLWPAMIGAAFVLAIAVAGFKLGYRFDDMLVYVDENGSTVGTEVKALVHHGNTKLHLAFSIFLFNSHGELLLQQRAITKKTWPGVWSNSCCGHVMLHESNAAAAKRRLKFELGIGGVELTEVLPDYRYRAEKDGVVENEICPVFVCFTDKEPKPNPSEVADVRWMKWDEFLPYSSDPANGISPWAAEEAHLLAENSSFGQLYDAKTNSISE